MGSVDPHEGEEKGDEWIGGVLGRDGGLEIGEGFFFTGLTRLQD
jgi:hypothetical protein